MAREPHFVVKYSSYLGTAIKLVLYILKQLFASVSVNSGGYLPRRSGSVNIHRYSPPLRRIIVKCCDPAIAISLAAKGDQEDYRRKLSFLGEQEN